MPQVTTGQAPLAPQRWYDRLQKLGRWTVMRVMMQAAVFSDVEGTLVDGSIPQIALAVGRTLRLFSAPKRLQVAVLERAGRLGPAKLERTLQLYALLRATAGMRPPEVARWTEALVPALTARFKPGSWRLLQAHQAAGLPLVLISGGLHEGIARLASDLGARGEGTKVHQRNGRYAGAVDGRVCQGVGKAERARAILNELGCDPSQCYAYGDTASDITFLELFGHPHAIDPDPRLAAEARTRGWPIIDGREGSTLDP
ncbi:MAG TPA: HAD family phosphatase [Herpetosiphonaceae bacterium]|nr:HAD family phosphatase [Herpetosiphonaceae bacterium]